MTAHTWLETREVEKRGNVVLDALFDPEFIIVHATREHQRQKIDRFHIHKTDARIIHRVDYKVDRTAGRTKNLALEDISVERGGKVEARGWVHTTIADLIVYYLPTWERAALLEIATLRSRWREIEGHDFLSTTTTTDYEGRTLKHPYNTWNYCPKIKWLEDNNFFKKIVDVENLQLRLW